MTVVFGTLFNNVKIKRYNAEGTPTETITVPLSYAPKQKWYAAVFSDNALEDGKPYAIKSPSMGFEMGGLTYDTIRKRNKLHRVRLSTKEIGYVGAPYTVDFTLYVFANKTSDWTQIVEQILPHFNPSLNVPVKVISNDNGDFFQHDIHVTLNSVAPDQNMYGDFRTRSVYTWALSFTLNMEFMGNLGDTGNIIGGNDDNPAIILNFYTSDDESTFTFDANDPVRTINLSEIDIV